MNDQAEKLRKMMGNVSEKQARTLAVVSGKGGVGKSNISINTAVLLTRKGYKVLLFDLDIGMGNVNILLGSSHQKTISDFLQSELSLQDIIQTGSDGISYIAGGNGLNEVAKMDDRMAAKLLAGFEEVHSQYDYVIFDMAAGATSATLKMLLAADEILVVTTPEPTAIMDAYSMIKYICLEGYDNRFMLVCNRADDEEQGRNTLHKLQNVSTQFLQRDLELLGIVLEDKHVRKAVIAQSALCISYPSSPASVCLNNIIDRYLEDQVSGELPIAKNSFIGKIRRLLFEKEDRGWRK